MAALMASENSTSASPYTLDVPPPPPATTATPSRLTTSPAQACLESRLRCQTPAINATSTGIEPTIIEAWLTLVSPTPTFWITTQMPTPSAPQTRISVVKAARRWRRAGTASNRAARPKRTTVSQPGASHSSESLDRGMLEPHSTPAEARARMAGRRVLFTFQSSGSRTVRTATTASDALSFGAMAVSLDEIDIHLLSLLQTDADVTNVDLARSVGLSPAATLHRVRHLKETGVIRVITARLDPAAAGFALTVYVAATLTRHDPRASNAFEEMLRSMPQVITADLVAGEMDYLITLVTRDVAELQQVLTQLAVRGGQRLLTYLKLQEVKAPSPLPLASPPPAGSSGRSTGARTAMRTRATRTTDTARRTPTPSATNPTSGGPARKAR